MPNYDQDDTLEQTLKRARNLQMYGLHECEKAVQIRMDVLRMAEETEGEHLKEIVAVLVAERIIFPDVNQVDLFEPYSVRLLALAQHRLGPGSLLTAKAGMNLAMVKAFVSRWSEAVLQARQALSILERELGPRDREVVHILRNLVVWSRNAGDHAEAEKLLREIWSRFPVCEHLLPLEEYVLAAGGNITDRGEMLGDHGVSEFVDVVLDVETLPQKLRLASCLEVTECTDPHYFFARGFFCTIHQDQLWGAHPTQTPDAKTVS